MNISFTDFGFDDLMGIVIMVNVVMNFLTLLLYEEYRLLKKGDKKEK